MTHQALAFLAVPARIALPAMKAAAEQSEVETRESAGALTLLLQIGAIRVEQEGDGVKLVASAATPADLQATIDLLAERIAAMGLSLQWRDPPATARPANLSIARIADIRPLTPSYARVTLEGPDLMRFDEGGFHFRLLFGPEGADWPHAGPGGVTEWPGGAQAWRRPVYTTRRLTPSGDGRSARLEFDVFLHEGGHVTAWTRRAAPGDEIAITGPGGGGALPVRGWTGIVCDETAVPIAARMLERLPDDAQGEAALIIADPGDAQDLPCPAGVRLRWLARGDGRSPLEALRALAIPPDDRFVFFAAERAEAEAARAHLRDIGLSKKDSRAAAYWTADHEQMDG